MTLSPISYIEPLGMETFIYRWNPLQKNNNLNKNAWLSQSQSAATKIPLKSLFILPENPNATLELAYFWKGGIKNLEKEMAVHEILCSSERALGAGAHWRGDKLKIRHYTLDYRYYRSCSQLISFSYM